jgi:serine/threonine protein kinase
MGTADDSTLPLPAGEGPLATTREETDPLVGAVLDHYRIESVLGRGGMGVVYRAYDMRLERAVAVKTVLLDRLAARERFQREARAQAKLQHKNVVTVHVVGEHAGLTYLVMELVPTGSLQDVVRREGKMPEKRALAIADAIASALEAAHARGLIHRDVKPSNVLVEADGNILLTDFGLAKELRASDETDVDVAGPGPRSLTEPGSALGTPAYRAPEQARGERVDHRADMYSLGVTLCELLTGERPSESPSLDGVSAVTKTLLARLLEETPDARYTTYAELRAALAEAIGARAVIDAPRSLRALGFVIDFVVSFAVGLLVVVVAQLVGQKIFGRDFGRTWAYPGMFVVAGGLNVLVETRSATTAGKRLLRLEDVEATTPAAPPRPRLALRALLKAIPYAALALNFAGIPPRGQGLWIVVASVMAMGLPAFGSRRSALHDRLTRTRVVRMIEQPR